MATIKVPQDVKVIIKRPNWQLIVDEHTGMKISAHFEHKSDLAEYACKRIGRLDAVTGKKLKCIRMDNAGENKKLGERLMSDAWKHSDITIEYTAANTPQQNSLAETGFTTLAARARSMMNEANIPNNFFKNSMGVNLLTRLD